MLNVKFVAEEKYRPQYANDTDARMDIKAKIVNNKPRQTWFEDYKFGVMRNTESMETENSIVLLPKEIRKIHTGLQVSVPIGYEMNMVVRSSVGIKKNLMLANGTGIIDAGYRDEIIMCLVNYGNEPVIINDGDRICQFAILKVDKVNPEFVQDDENFRQGDRGGGIGSTGV